MADNRSSAENKLFNAINAKKTGTPSPSSGAAPAGTPAPAAAKTGGLKKKPVKRVAIAKVATHAIGTALIIEPNKRIASNLENMLKSLKLNAYIVTTGQEALLFLEHSEVAVAFVDLELPDISGFNLCSKIRATNNGRDIAIILSSTSRDPVMKDQAMMVDANDHISKPISTSELHEMVEKYVLKKMRLKAKLAPKPEPEKEPASEEQDNSEDPSEDNKES